ncbi:MarR family winged helix-turn-helix transcriptional regulator [Sorangium sp. So ce1000]|uniref:MarR family winged helix-turn-helix transcriptional regulator n=1 Tax=Sorangium sp. So ce1000 TaxID=3133325 RepID=UPI003F63B5D4
MLLISEHLSCISHAMEVKGDPAWAPESAPTFWVNHASRLIMRHFEEQLRPLGFGMAYLPVVMALEENGPLLQRDLLERARVEQPTMAALLARMERDGLIVRLPDPTDGRARQVSLTATAKARLPKVMHAMQHVVERAMSGVSERERAALMATLRRVVENLSDPAAE